MHTNLLSPSWRRLLAGALLAAVPLFGWTQQADADPPGRVAYISALDGGAQIAAPGGDWSPAAPNWPVTTGTHIAIEPGARAELHGGWTALRLAGRARLDATLLDDATTQVALTEGALSVRVRELQPGERVEIDTPQLAVVASQPGEYRIDVDPASDTTRVAVHAGAATVYGETGQSGSVGGGQQAVFAGRALSVVQRSGAARDGLDQWAAVRDAQEDQSVSARYVSRDMPGYQLLDSNGQWAQDATYGAVWYPAVSTADWAPYRYGRWTWVEPWGWTWVDDAPWGFAPSHYGRWAQIGPRWAWVPGPAARRPVYAPALVGFVGGGSGGTQWGVSVGSGLPAAAWFPLAPGEYWQPGSRASDRYRSRLNWGDHRPPPAEGYRFQRRPEAISVAPPGGFGGRSPRFGDGSRLPPGALGNARVVPPPPRGSVGTSLPPRGNMATPMPPHGNVAPSMPPRGDAMPPRGNAVAPMPPRENLAPPRLPRERDAQSMPPRGHEQAVPLQTPRAPAPVDRPAFTPRDNGAVQGRERQEDARSMHERPWQAPVQQRPQSEAAPRPPQQQPPRMAQPQQVPQARPEFNNRPPQQERGQAPSAAPRERPAPRGGPRNLDDLH